MRRFERFAPALIAALSSAPAFAAGEVSVADLPVYHSGEYRLGLSTSVKAMQGAFDPYGAYIPLPDGSKSVGITNILSASYRLDRRWEGGFMMPIRRMSMVTPTGQMSSYSVSSPTVSFRYHAGGWPHWVFHFGGSGPWTWRDAHIVGYPRASMPDDMGDGMMAGASVQAGVGMSRSFQALRIALDAGTILPFAAEMPSNDAPDGSPPITIRKGPRLQANEGMSYALSRSWSLQTSFKQSFAGDTYANGFDELGTASRSFTSGFGASFAPDASWKLSGAYDSQWPFYDYAVNQPYSPTFTFSMSYRGI